MRKTVEEYLACGHDLKSAKYFAGGRKRIMHVAPAENFTLLLTFDNGEKRLLDMKPILEPGTVFEPFMNKDNFNRVYLDGTGSVAWDIDPAVDSEEVWNNKVDLCPDSCYMDSQPVEIVS